MMNESYIDWILERHNKSLRAYELLKETGAITEKEFQNYCEAQTIETLELLV